MVSRATNAPVARSRGYVARPDPVDHDAFPDDARSGMDPYTISGWHFGPTKRIAPDPIDVDAFIEAFERPSDPQGRPDAMIRKSTVNSPPIQPDQVDPDEFFRQMFDPRYPLAWGGRYKPQRGGKRQMGQIACKVAFVAGVVSIIAALVMALGGCAPADGGCLLSAEQRADVCGWPEWWSR
jgi:hypothetical protein